MTRILSCLLLLLCGCSAPWFAHPLGGKVKEQQRNALVEPPAASRDGSRSTAGAITVAMDYIEVVPERQSRIYYSNVVTGPWSVVWERTNDWRVCLGNTHWPRTVPVVVSNCDFYAGMFYGEHTDFNGRVRR